MGCTSSKLDDLPAVKLCRDRCYYLDEAIRQRYAFSDSHSAYIQSLKGFGFSLDRFFDNTNNNNQDLDDKIPISASSSLRIPSGRKVVDSLPSNPHPPSNSGSHLHSHSHSGSHLQFHSDSEDSDEDDDGDESSGSPDHHLHDHHGHGDMNSHFHNQHHLNQHGGNVNGNGYMTMNYMRNHSTQSVVYEQRPMSPETVHFGESSSSYHQPYYSYPNYENNMYDSGSYGSYNYPPQPVYSNYGGMGMGGGDGDGGFFGSSAPYGSYSSPPRQQHYSMASSSGSKPPPPPPSPPRASPWDFLDPFTSTFEKYYPPQTPSRDSREVREEEGIPELEDEDYQNEVVKEVHGNQRLSGESGGGNFTKNVRNEEGKQKKKAIDREDAYQTRNIVPEKNQGVEYEVHLVEKNFVAKEEQPKEPINVAAFKGRFTTVSEVVREIKAQFERASDSGIEVAKILEAGKLPYNRKNAVYHVSSKMLYSITPSMSVGSSQPSTPPTLERDGSVFLEFNGDIQRRLLNLSSTLQKLYNWEKKLYEEVKAEEKMRLIHERKSRRLKRMDEKGAEAHKVDATRILVQTLSTKIRIAIQVVEKISVKINKLRDEELCPQINQLIHGLIKMWAVMLECHRNQCQAIAEAKNLDAIAFNKNLNDDHLEASVQLELELLNWILRFSSWVIAQKAFVKALNSWLLKCLLHEPEETEDGLAPFSPGRIGAPQVFVICNQWFRAMERISEKEVLDTMRVFAASVHHLCEQHNVELRQRMTGNRDLERRVKAIEREEQKMHKALQVVDKQMVLLSGQGYGLSLPGIVEPSDTTNAISLQSGLKRIFESMERFMASSMQAYGELRVIGEETRPSRENAQVT